MRIGTTELILVIIIALVVFGPGKLPELGRMLGKAIGSIKHYSDPNTWEKQASAEEAELRKEERENAAVSDTTAAAAGVAAAADDNSVPAGSGSEAQPEDGLPIRIDVSAEAPDEDAADLSEMEGKSIDEIAGSLLKSTRQDADA